MDSALFFRFQPNGKVQKLGAFFGSESYRANRTVLSPRPFGRRQAVATAGQHFHYGSGDRFEIRTYTVQGKLVRVVRSNRPNPTLTRDVIDQFVEWRLSRIKSAQERTADQALYASMRWPETLPAFADLQVDGDGNIWASGFHHLLEPQPHWTVVDTDGKVLGNIDAPPGFTAFDIGSDYILGKITDELDVERVVLYRLIKPRASSGRSQRGPRALAIRTGANLTMP